MQIASIGIDLGKTTFHLVALDERGNTVIKQMFSRSKRGSIYLRRMFIHGRTTK
jgi:hypothetical protein